MCVYAQLCVCLSLCERERERPQGWRGEKKCAGERENLTEGENESERRKRERVREKCIERYRKGA